MGSFSSEPFRLGSTLKHNHGLLLPLASANSFCVNCHNACNFQELAQKRYLQVIQCLKTVVLQSLSHVQLFATPWTAACQTPLFSTISWSLLNFMFIESVRLPNHSSSATAFSFCLSQHQVIMATQYFKRNLLLNLYREGKNIASLFLSAA